LGTLATTVRHYLPQWARLADNHGEEIDRMADTAQWLPMDGADWQRYCLPADGPLRRVRRDELATAPR
jgi:hypothetical protein